MEDDVAVFRIVKESAIGLHKGWRNRHSHGPFGRPRGTGLNGDCDEERVRLLDGGVVEVDCISLDKLSPAPVRRLVGEGMVVSFFAAENCALVNGSDGECETEETLALPSSIVLFAGIQGDSHCCFGGGSGKMSKTLRVQWLCVEVNGCILRSKRRVSGRCSRFVLETHTHIIVPALSIE